jgi:non-specific serine/threonine protein kinase
VTALKEKYGPGSVAEWHGGVDQATRDAGEAAFQARRKRFMVATSAGAKGRTWTAGTLAVYYSNSHDLELREQSEDRTHRIGTTGIVSYVDLVIPKTLDEKIIEALRAKKSVARAALQEGLEAWI